MSNRINEPKRRNGGYIRMREFMSPKSKRFARANAEEALYRECDLEKDGDEKSC
jgi:hypothetical protein